MDVEEKKPSLRGRREYMDGNSGLVDAANLARVRPRESEAVCAQNKRSDKAQFYYCQMTIDDRKCYTVSLSLEKPSTCLAYCRGFNMILHACCLTITESSNSSCFKLSCTQ
jgi:hypothetical protein